MDLYDLLGNLQEIGFYDLLLPWALFFAITYGVLIKAGPFSKDNVDKSIPAIISMAIAFFAVNYIPYDMLFGEYLSEIFGKGGTIIAGLLVAIILLGLAGIELPMGFGKDNQKRNFAAVVLGLVAIIYFTTGLDRFVTINTPTFAQDTLVTGGVILAVAGIIYFMLKDNKKDENKGESEQKTSE